MLRWRRLRHVISTGMRRILSVSVLSVSRCIGCLFYPVPTARTAERVRGIQVNLQRTFAAEPPNMDLSNMRKKYKGDEEVSGCRTSGLPVSRFIMSHKINLHSSVRKPARSNVPTVYSSCKCCSGSEETRWTDVRLVPAVEFQSRSHQLRKKAKQTIDCVAFSVHSAPSNWPIGFCLIFVFLLLFFCCFLFFVPTSALKRANSLLWTQLNSLEIGLMRPQSAQKLERPTLCASPLQQSKQRTTQWCHSGFSSVLQYISFLPWEEMDGRLHAWSSWKVTAMKASASSPTTKAEKVLSWWVGLAWIIRGLT